MKIGIADRMTINTTGEQVPVDVAAGDQGLDLTGGPADQDDAVGPEDAADDVPEQEGACGHARGPRRRGSGRSARSG